MQIVGQPIAGMNVCNRRSDTCIVCNDDRYYVIYVTTALVLVAWTIVVVGVMTVVHIPH
jgi:hypothetical protein